MGKKGCQFNVRGNGRGNKKFERESRDSSVIARENLTVDGSAEELSDSDENCTLTKISVNICLWEFGQNDPKRYIYFFALI